MPDLAIRLAYEYLWRRKSLAVSAAPVIAQEEDYRTSRHLEEGDQPDK